MDLHFENIRREYDKRSLSASDLTPTPFDLVTRWLQDAVEAKTYEPTAVIVGTATPDGHPSTRTVLLKVLMGRSARLGLFAQPSHADEAAAERAMKLVGVPHLADKRCSCMSGGELVK